MQHFDKETPAKSKKKRDKFYISILDVVHACNKPNYQGHKKFCF